MARLWESTRSLVTGLAGGDHGGSTRSFWSAGDTGNSGRSWRCNIEENSENCDASCGDSCGRTCPSFSRRGLEAMLRERDETIASLEKARLVEVQMLAEVRSSLDGLRKEYRHELYWRDFEISHLKKERTDALERLAAFQNDLRNEDLARDIAKLIMEVAPKKDNLNNDDISISVCDETTESYIANLQSKLCKAMHKMNVMSNQMKKIRVSCDEVVKSLQVEINDVVEEKCKIEVELMNRIDTIDHEKRLSEEQLGAKLEYKQCKIEELEDNLADLRDMALGDEALEEERKELEAAKEEVRRLKKSNKAKQRKIDQMKEIQLIERNGESKLCGSSVFSQTSENASLYSDDEDDVSRLSNEDVGPIENGNIVSIVTRIARVTSHMEKDVNESLVKREKILDSLKDRKMSLADAAKDNKFARSQILGISMSASQEESKLCNDGGNGGDEKQLSSDGSTPDRRRLMDFGLIRSSSAKY